MSETSKQYEGGESPEKPISYADIEDQLERDSILEKPYHRGSQAMEQVIQQCNVPADIAQKLTRLGRDNLHLLRMLRRSEAERSFSLAYLRHRDDIFAEDQKGTHTIASVIGTEGADTMMFWTFAPYLFKALTEKGVSERDAISKILSWSKDGVTTRTEFNKPYGESTSDGARLHLKGLEKFNAGFDTGWILDQDPNHVSHKYTEQEAKHLADLLIAENDEK